MSNTGDIDDPVIAALAAGLGQMLPDMPVEDRLRFARSIRGGEPYAPGPDSQRREGVPHGALREGTCPPGAIYPGLEHVYRVYVPAQYDGSSDAALMVFQDGARYLGPEAEVIAVLDNLVAAGELPPIVAVFAEPGARGPGLPVYGGGDNRSIEYDRTGDDYARFLIEELLPAATQGLRITANPALRAICGLSSGGVCAFNAAWERPDAFGLVLSHCGSFVDLRGGHLLAPAVRRAPPRPLRVFLQTGVNDLDILFGNWPQANLAMASALAYRGYDHKLVVGEGGHSLAHGGAILPDSLRWLWRGWREAGTTEERP
jgi:enterochelin esterase family protein